MIKKMKTKFLIITISVILILFAFYGIFNMISDVQQPSSVIPNVTILSGSDTMEHNLSPDKITITVGEQVTWFNDDNTSHWIDADDGSWSSGLISSQNYFTKKFENVGIYTYHGKPWIRGTVIVTEKHNELEDKWITLTPKTNTIIIYDVTENGKTRLSIAPHTLVMNLTDGNIIRFVNDGSTPVNIFDRATGIWRFDDVKPLSQRVLTINSTGFYEILVQNSREGESGRIVVLDNNVNSLSVGDRIKMGKAIISDNFRKYPELVSVGVGSGEIGVHVTINKKELELHEDAKSYYHEKFSKIIPFEVPIVIEFGEPIKPE